jgi:hypothetical protein
MVRIDGGQVDLVAFAMAEIGDQVGPDVGSGVGIRFSEDEAVGAVPALQPIVPRPARKPVIAAAAVEGIVASVPGEAVGRGGPD